MAGLAPGHFVWGRLHRLQRPSCWDTIFAMATRDQIASKVASSILLSIGAGLVSSIVIYVGLADFNDVTKNWAWLAFLTIATGLIFEYGRILAYKGES
jgi:hypothetical protein